MFLKLANLFGNCGFVSQLVGQFIARAVKDQILSKTYIEGYKGKVDCEHARCVVVVVVVDVSVYKLDSFS